MTAACVVCHRYSLTELCRRCEEAQARVEDELDRRADEQERRERRTGAA